MQIMWGATALGAADPAKIRCDLQRGKAGIKMNEWSCIILQTTSHG